MSSNTINIIAKPFDQENKRILLHPDDLAKYNFEIGSYILIRHKKKSTIGVVSTEGNIHESAKIGSVAARCLNLKSESPIFIEKCSWTLTDKTLKLHCDQLLTERQEIKILEYIRKTYNNFPFVNKDVIYLSAQRIFDLQLTSDIKFTIEYDSKEFVIINNLTSIECISKGDDFIYNKIPMYKRLETQIEEVVFQPILNRYLLEQTHISFNQLFYLTGSPTILKRKLIERLCKSHKIYFEYISFNDDFAKPPNFSKIFSEISTYLKAEQTVIVYIDNLYQIMRVSNPDIGTKSILLQLLSSLRTNEHIVTLIPIIDVKQIDEIFEMEGTFNIDLYFPLPNDEARMILLQHYLNQYKIHSLDIDYFIKLTKDYTETNLQCLAFYISNYMIQNNLNQPIDKNILDYAINLINFTIVETPKNQSQKEIEENIQIHLKNVIGLTEAKQALRNTIGRILHPSEIEKEMNASISHGILLHGPPGCGKTLLCYEMAKAYNCRVKYIKGPEIIAKYIGDSSKNVRMIFDEAKKIAPCIVFIDEIDSVAINRDTSGDMSSALEHNNVVNQILIELDELNRRNSNVILICATNRPNMIDHALIRPGRIDYKIYVGLPTLSERREMFLLYLSQTTYNPTINLDLFSQKTEGYSGSDIALIVGQAKDKVIAEINYQKIDRSHRIEENDLAYIISKIQPSNSKESLQLYFNFDQQIKKKDEKNSNDALFYS